MIAAFQHVGMGVHDAGRAYRFYRDLLGFRVRLSDRTRYADEVKTIIGALVEMRIILAVNMAGGAAAELVEHTSTRPLEPVEPVQWGDIGYLEVGLKAYHLEELYLDLKRKGVEFLTPVRSMELSRGGRERYAYLRDPEGTLIQLVEVSGGKRPAVGGVRHVAIGVSDMDKAREFYGGVLGFGEVIHEFRGRLPELEEVTGRKEMELVILGHRPETGSALPLLDRVVVKLVHTPGYKGKLIFEGRRWGDIGLMEIAFNVGDLGVTVNDLISKGVGLLQPPNRAALGSGTRGSFAYVVNPDGGIIKIVEVERILHVSPKAVKKAPGWLLKAAAGLAARKG